MKISVAFSLLFILLSSCSQNSPNSHSEKGKLVSIDCSNFIISAFEQRIQSEQLIQFNTKMRAYNLIDIQSLDSTIHVNIKYATKDNFMKMKLYTTIQKAYLQIDVAEKIVACQNFLKTIHPSYSLLIYDAVRPVSVQQKMWDALDSIPRFERGKFVSNPSHRSMHNYGAAVDITIIDEANNPLDMGSYFDDIRKIAYPSLEYKFLATGELTKVQVEHRILLRAVMKSQNFRNLTTEWWHFNACSKEEARSKYPLLFVEPN